MNHREADNASGSLLVELHSIVKPLDLAQVFPKPQPLEVELGCGDASFLVEYARRNPDQNFIGVERLLGRIQKLDRKGRRAGLANLRGVRIESAYFLQYLLPPHAATALHIYFPDPWPKKKHRRHRLINESFPGARPHRARARRHGLSADGRCGLFCANDRSFWCQQRIFKKSKRPLNWRKC